MTERSMFTVAATRPVAVSMIITTALVFGLIGLWRLPVNLLPDMTYPTLTVRTEYPGASPQDVEERVSERIQESVAVTPGVRRAVSVSRPGVSDVQLQFQWGTRMEFAVADVRERLDRVFLPKEAKQPLVLHYDPSLDPILTLGLSGSMSEVELRRLAEEELERGLEGTEALAAVKVRGGDEEEIRIAIDEAALSAHGLDVRTVASQVGAANLNVESGKIEEGKTEFLVRAVNEFRSLTDIENTVIERRGSVSILLKDVATVRRIPADKQVLSRCGGKTCVLIDVHRQANANIVKLCDRVRTLVFGSPAQQAYVAAGKHLIDPKQALAKPNANPGAPTTGAQNPDKQALEAAAAANRERERMTSFLAFRLQQFGAEVTLLQDQSGFIKSSIDDLKSNAITGAWLAILVLYLFLRRFAPTLVLTTLIPISLLITFAPMYLSDISLNVMSLGGLALGVGNLTDNAIVILESIATLRGQGMTRVRAAVLGTARVAGAVIASTLTTVAVFLPIVFVEGVSGQLFRDQAIAVVWSQVISLVVALFLVPMLSAWQPSGSDVTLAKGFVGRKLQALCALVVRATAAVGLGLLTLLRWILAPLLAVFDRVWGAVEVLYPRALASALRLSWLVLLLTVAAVSFAAWRITKLGNEAMPQVHQGELHVHLFLPRDATVERTDAVIAPIERQIAALPDVERTFLASGVEREELNSSDEGEHSARILLRMKPARDRVVQEARVRDAIDAMIRAEPQIQEHRFSRPSVFDFQTQIVIEVLGKDLFALRKVCDEVVTVLRDMPGIRDLRSTLQRGNTEVAIQLDREKLSALNLQPGAVSKILQTKVQGEVPTRFTERERKLDIRVQTDRDDLTSYSRLQSLNINPAGQPPIPLEAVAELRRIEGPSEIRRIGNMRGAEVHATYAGLRLRATQEKIDTALFALQLPRGVSVRIGGDRDEVERSGQSLNLALALALFLVFVVLASQFESLLQPLIILVAAPLALVGVVPVLDALDIPISVVVLLGAIVLIGIVVNNAIILIDIINQLRREGRPTREAILVGAKERLRPVFMTMLTTVLGLLPLTGWLRDLPLLGGAEDGAELRSPMAITILTGLTTSTVLTLLVVPVIYYLTHGKGPLPRLESELQAEPAVN